MEQDFETRLRATGVTRGAYAVLSAIYHDKKSNPAELTQFLGVDGAAITRHLDRIEQQGLVERKQNATDRRSIDIKLTREGIKAVRRGRADSEATNTKFTACLSEEEAENLRATLQTMLASAGQKIADV